jgi:hypothetical protein
LCFLAVYIHAASPPGFRSVVDAVLACAVVNLLLAAVDVSGWALHAGDPLAFLRNANYRMLDEATMSGFKRIVGSFPETSAFAYFTLGQFAFCTSLWLSGIRGRVTCPLAVLSLLALLFATSSTGYAGAAGFLIIAFAVGLGRMLSRPVTRQTVLFVLAAPLVAVTLLLGVSLDHASWQMLQGMLDNAVLDKLSSQSGIERGAWTQQALVNFFETYGLGGGTGSVRASSFPIAVLGNIGAFGALVYGGFMLALFCRRAGRWDNPYPAACQSAARWACLTLLIGASVAGSFVDLGLPFFIFAALACAGPAAARLARPRPAPSAAAFPLAGVRS